MLQFPTKPDCPCKPDCPDRNAECHCEGHCKKNDDYKIEYAKWKLEYDKIKSTDNDYSDLRKETSLKIKRNKHSTNRVLKRNKS